MKIKVLHNVPQAHPSITVGAILPVVSVENDGVRVDAPWGNHVPSHAYTVTDGDVRVPEPITAHDLKKPVVKAGRRVFGAGYKLRMLHVYDCLNYRDKGEFLKKHNLNYQLLSYWRKQESQGHFSIERAVAFARGAVKE